MKTRNWLGVSLVILVLAFVGGWVSAQTQTVPVPPTVLTGADIGFRVEGQRAGVAVGRLVVRIDGRWVETDSTGQVRRLTSY
jgi:hypothetical protein